MENRKFSEKLPQDLQNKIDTLSDNLEKIKSAIQFSRDELFELLIGMEDKEFHDHVNFIELNYCNGKLDSSYNSFVETLDNINNLTKIKV
jgi:hypothetical protein